MVVKAIANLSTPTWYHSTEVERESAGDDIWGTPRRGKKKKTAKKAFIWYELDAENVRLDDQREGHPCTLEALFRQVEGLKAGIEGSDLEVSSG